MKYLVNIDLNRNELQNAVIQPLGTAPASGQIGQIYYNTADHVMYQHDGTAWVAVGSVLSVNGKSGAVTVQGGTSLTVDNSGSNIVINHNDVETTAAVSVAALEKITTDGYGHIVTTTAVTAADIPNLPWSKITSGNEDLAAIEALAGTNGLLKKTAENTWVLDTNTYLTTHQTVTLEGGTNNGTLKLTTAAGAVDNIAVTGLEAAAYKDVVTSVDNSASLPTAGAVKTYVDTALSDLPEPMIFKGSLGTGGTITALPTASSENEGFTYKVITDGTYASQAAKVGDTFISDGSTWVLIPSGDEPSGTVTSVGIANGGLITVSGSPVTTSGTITVGHGTPTGAAVTASGLYKISTDAYGHVDGTAAVQKSDLTSIIGNATQSADGLMSAEDKATLDSLEAASSGALTSGSITLTAGQTSVSASSIASKLVSYQGYMGGESVVVDFTGSAFTIAVAQATDVIIKYVVTV